MANSKEFTKFMNKLDDYGEKLTMERIESNRKFDQLEEKLREIRIELNQAVIDGKLNQQ